MRKKLQKTLRSLGMVKKQLQVFHFGNDSIIPFPQITIKNNIGNRNILNYIFVIPKYIRNNPYMVHFLAGSEDSV